DRPSFYLRAPRPREGPNRRIGPEAPRPRGPEAPRPGGGGKAAARPGVGLPSALRPPPSALRPPPSALRPPPSALRRPCVGAAATARSWGPTLPPARVGGRRYRPLAWGPETAIAGRSWPVFVQFLVAKSP